MDLGRKQILKIFKESAQSQIITLELADPNTSQISQSSFVIQNNSLKFVAQKFLSEQFKSLEHVDYFEDFNEFIDFAGSHSELLDLNQKNRIPRNIDKIILRKPQQEQYQKKVQSDKKIRDIQKIPNSNEQFKKQINLPPLSKSSAKKSSPRILQLSEEGLAKQYSQEHTPKNAKILQIKAQNKNSLSKIQRFEENRSYNEEGNFVSINQKNAMHSLQDEMIIRRTNSQKYLQPLNSESQIFFGSQNQNLDSQKLQNNMSRSFNLKDINKSVNDYLQSREQRIYDFGVLMFTIIQKIAETSNQISKDSPSEMLEQIFGDDIIRLINNMREKNPHKRPNLNKIIEILNIIEKTEQPSQKVQNQEKELILKRQIHIQDLDIKNFDEIVNFPKPLRFQTADASNKNSIQLTFFPFFSQNVSLFHLKTSSQKFKYELKKLNIDFLIPENSTTIMMKNQELVFLAGGDNFSGFFQYDAKHNTLLPLQNMMAEFERKHFGFCSKDDQIFIIGGIKDEQITNQCEVYDLKKECWFEIATLERNCSQCSVCLFQQNFIYKFGGIEQKNSISQRIDKYEISQDRWSQISCKFEFSKGFNFCRGSVSLQINNKQIFIFGGIDSQGGNSKDTCIIGIYEEKLNGEKNQIQLNHVVQDVNRFRCNLDLCIQSSNTIIWDQQVISYGKQSHLGSIVGICLNSEGYWRAFFEKQ